MLVPDDQLVLIAPGFREQRRAPRKVIRVAATIRGSAVGRIPVILTDISPLGCQMQAYHHFNLGSYLIVQVPSFEPFGARVVWAEDGLAGFEFSQRLHRAVVEHIIAMSTLERGHH